jgi:nucleotide-binding universal stress UspA family protein
MLIGDPVVKPIFDAAPDWVHYLVPALGAALVVAIGKVLAARGEQAHVELAPVQGAGVPRASIPGGHRVVLAVDGSAGSLAAARYVEELPARLAAGTPLEVELVNVQRGVSGDVAAFVSREALQGYHRERSDQALSAVRAELDRAGIGYTQHQFIGEPGRVIAACAAEQHADEIVMGTRGLGTHTGGVVGSVTQSTLEHATVPVVVVK